MADKITKEQLEELRDAINKIDFHKLLEEYTGITAIAYEAFQYFDAAGNYMGDSNDSDVLELLKNAYIEVIDDGK